MTGGEAVYSSNDLTGKLERVTEDAGNYYTLTYSPSDTNFDGRLRHIQIKLKGKDYHLAYRRAYYGLGMREAKPPAYDPIEAAMEHGAPEEWHLIFGVHVTVTPPVRDMKEERSQGRKQGAEDVQTYTIQYTIMAQQLRIAGGTAPRLEIAAAVYDADGRVLNSTINRTQQDNTVGKEVPTPKAYRIEVTLSVPRTAKFMRFAVRDNESGKLGVMEISLPVHR